MKMVSKFFILTLLAIISGCCCGKMPESSQWQEIQSGFSAGLGDSYYNNGEYDKALEFYKKSVEESPNEPRAYFSLAKGYEALKDTQLAKENYLKAKELAQTSNLADKNELINKINTKLQKLNNTSYQTSTGSQSNVNTQESLFKIKELKTQIENNPEEAENYINIGHLYYDTKQYNLALKSFEKALKLNPNSIEQYKNIGKVYLAKKEFAKADSYFKKYTDPNSR